MKEATLIVTAANVVGYIGNSADVKLTLADSQQGEYASASANVSPLGKVTWMYIQNNVGGRMRRGTAAERELLEREAIRAAERQAALNKTRKATEAYLPDFTVDGILLYLDADPAEATDDEINEAWEAYTDALWERDANVANVQAELAAKQIAKVREYWQNLANGSSTYELPSDEEAAAIVEREEREAGAHEATQALAEEYGAAGVAWVREALAKAYELGRKAGEAR